jgi:hypothetical protein
MTEGMSAQPQSLRTHRSAVADRLLVIGARWLNVKLSQNWATNPQPFDRARHVAQPGVQPNVAIAGQFAE